MAFTPFIESDQPTMTAFNEKFSEAISTAINEALDAGTKVEIGSYVGTGTYGASNPNSLTFEFEPKILIISLGTGDGNGVCYPGIAILNVSGGMGSYVRPTNMYDLGSEISYAYFTYGTLVVSSSSTTVSWYSTKDKYAQFNHSWIYHYFAIG